MSSNDRRTWSLEEDEAIKELVLGMGISKWCQVAGLLKKQYGIKNRTGKQCRERWHNHLDPSINRDPWTPKEDKLILELQKKHGNSWSEIAKFLPGRTDNAIKNRFYSTIRRNLRKFNRKRPKSLKITGPLKSILKDSETVELIFKEKAPPRRKAYKDEEDSSDSESLSGSFEELEQQKGDTKNIAISETDETALSVTNTCTVLQENIQNIDAYNTTYSSSVECSYPFVNYRNAIQWQYYTSAWASYMNLNMIQQFQRLLSQ
ncbi:unnamed protein product [Blepharisma stoltei]|uniref:Myb-like DNA-binding domain containing protein n=1 Tax=Blepharisma stoltei TaxID=1481888 RepID=A0AAU9K024_9CILI|nr:unnamed protein product [Blepharisma stoltei]